MNILVKHIKKHLPLYILLSPLIFISGGFLLWITVVIYSNSHPAIGENVKQVSWLPPEATNVSYYKTYSWTAYEFDIDEAGFRKWADDYKLSPIKEPQKIRRYLSFIGNNKDVYAVVSKGLFYSKSKGVYIHLVYDADKRRAYYRFNPR
jgi:hypothetical protein